MGSAQGHIGGLILAQPENSVPARYLRDPVYHHPMLGTLPVELKAQAGSRLDHNALDLEALASHDRFEAPPGPMHSAMGAGQVAIRVLDERDKVLEVASPIFTCDQHGVGGLDYYQVLAAEHRHQARISVDETVFGVINHDLTAHYVTGVILGRDCPQGLPTPDVGPPGGKGYHRC